eukprot:3513648-Prymnesium_polylepis.1
MGHRPSCVPVVCMDRARVGETQQTRVCVLRADGTRHADGAHVGVWTPRDKAAPRARGAGR